MEWQCGGGNVKNDVLNMETDGVKGKDQGNSGPYLSK